jgi:hypothetical protein
LKFIGKQHIDEGKQILNKLKDFDYDFKNRNFSSLTISDFYNESLKISDISLSDRIRALSKTQLIRDELSCISYECENFTEIYLAILFALKKEDAPRELKLNILRVYKKILDESSNGEYCIKGLMENSEGKNTLQIIKNESEPNTIENRSLPSLIINGLDLNEFLKIEPFKRYNLLLDENLNSDDDIELMLFFLELSEHYQKEVSSDLLSLLAALLIEFHLNMNVELIDNYINRLMELIESQIHEVNEDFESMQFRQIIDFLGRKEINGYRIKTTKKIKDLLLEKYFDFNLYKDSFISGCKLINLFSKLKIEFPENEIVERILEDLNYLIEENDYNDLQEIDCSYIDNIYQKKYFPEFYTAINRIPVEDVRIDLSTYVFGSIIEVKGLNHNTVSFFKENANEYPGMYLWAKKRLSQKLLEKNEELSYVVIKDNNDLLLERLLLNIVSKIENLKDELNIHILKHYGLNWVIELDNEYERLIAN